MYVVMYVDLCSSSIQILLDVEMLGQGDVQETPVC